MSYPSSLGEESRRVLITGGTSGIGFQAAVRMLKAGNKLIHNTLSRLSI